MNTTRETKIINAKGRTKGYYFLAVLILVLVAAHFIAQLTFIAGERLQIEEAMVSAVPLAEKTADVPMDTPDLITPSGGPFLDPVLKERAVVQRVKVTDGDHKAERTIQKERVRRPVASQQNKAKAESERLRRAEKLLTGFWTP